MYSQQLFLCKFAEVLGHLKSLFWKIMSQHIIQPIRITPRFCKLSSLVSFFVFFVHYINRNHKDTKHPQGARLDTTLYVEQNVNQVYQPEFLRIWRVWIFLFKKSREFSLNRDILKLQKNDFRLFLYTLIQYPHQQKSFGVLLIYCMLNVGIFILFYSAKNMLFGGDLWKMVFL